MMNYITCCVFNTKSVAKFIDPDGNQQLIEIPAKVAELMLESPGHIVVSVEALRRTRWICAMKADEELHGGKMYMMLPAKRVNCRASDGEMRVVDDVTCRKKKGKSQIHPAEEMTREKISQDDDEAERESCFPGPRRNNYRQWRPVLETINEGI